MTKSDITTMAEFRSDKVTLFGVHLGMSRKGAEEILRRNEKLSVEEDEKNATRLYVSDRTEDGSKNLNIAYYIWPPEVDELAQITIFEGCAPYLVGRTKRLPTADAITPESDIYESFLGAPDRSEVTLEIAMIGVKQTTYYYDSKRLNVINNCDNGKNSISLALVAESKDKAEDEAANTIEYRCSSFPSYTSVRDSNGNLTIPEQRVYFGEDLQKTHALGVKYGNKFLACPATYQDVAYLVEGTERTVLRVLAYGGCPFQVRDLAMEKAVHLRERTVLMIAAADGDKLELTQDSAMPWIATNRGLVYMCAAVVNIEWKFLEAGMTFETENATYTTTKPGATIAFTEEGIKMTDVRVAPKNPVQGEPGE